MIFLFNWVIVRFQPWIFRGVLREYLGQPNFGEIFADGVDESNNQIDQPVSFKESTMLVYWSVGSSRSFFTGFINLKVKLQKLQDSLAAESNARSALEKDADAQTLELTQQISDWQLGGFSLPKSLKRTTVEQ